MISICGGRTTSRCDLGAVRGAVRPRAPRHHGRAVFIGVVWPTERPLHRCRDCPPPQLPQALTDPRAKSPPPGSGSQRGASRALGFAVGETCLASGRAPVLKDILKRLPFAWSHLVSWSFRCIANRETDDERCLNGYGRGQPWHVGAKRRAKPERWARGKA
jgi:hypothetical protein